METSRAAYQSEPLKRLRAKMAKMGRRIHEFKVEGCSFELKVEGLPLRTGWRVLTSSESIYHSLYRRCPGHKEHCLRGDVRREDLPLLRYPKAMMRKIMDGISWVLRKDLGVKSLTEDIEREIMNEKTELGEQAPDDDPVSHDAMALARHKIPEEAPTGKRLEEVRKMMLRVQFL